ncbi:serine/threonine protein kinase [Haliangium ochraceum DSM 14365]|uniref:Serine/threonine protein kinase n=2 Tax=Haliangium ochraceum TaxID=80816 RepID=D0LHE2_HALO1|nr:serine/threonine protein kinase [Haliangium ochraceum DSM 14365]
MFTASPPAGSSTLRALGAASAAGESDDDSEEAGTGTAAVSLLPAEVTGSTVSSTWSKREVLRAAGAARSPVPVPVSECALEQTGPLVSAGLLREDRSRAGMFLRLTLSVIAASSCSLLFIDGDPLAEGIAAAGMAYTAAVFIWYLRRSRGAAAPSDRQSAFLVVSTLLASYSTVYLWGLLSPMVIIFTLSLAVLGQSVRARPARAGYLACACAQLGLSLALALGLVRDRGLIPFDTLGPVEIVVSQLAVHAMYLIAFLVARQSRRAAITAMAQLEQAARETERRDVLLEEARQELDAALRVGAAGRYTGQRMGSFRLGVLIGNGAMGEVYEAAHHETGALAAVKLLHRHLLLGQRQVQRFLREAEFAVKLCSPHVVRVLEYGRDTEEAPYLAMERLDGVNLAEYLRARERLSLPEVVTLVEHIATGLEAAWQAGIIHRDIKPQNVFRADASAARPCWKIVDFGVSKMAEQSVSLTHGNIVGTPSYMAPEQVEGGEVDHRSDLFALAAVAYRALTGRPAFGGTELSAVLYRVVHRMPEAPSLLSTVPADIDAVFALALAKSPGQRFASGSELSRALRVAAAGNLPEELRARARTLLARHPWNTVARPIPERPATVDIDTREL